MAKTADLIARQGSNSLSVVLAAQPPTRLPPRPAQGTAPGAGPAGVIDDLDLCRLLNPGGRQPNLVIGLLEIILEQQKWTRPVAVRRPRGNAGAHGDVRRPPPGGRGPRPHQQVHAAVLRPQARQDGRCWKFIEQTWDNQELPSHLKLRVLYVPIVGVHTEADLVSRVIEQLQKRLGFSAPDVTSAGFTADTLVRFTHKFIDERPDESLLFVLDEADEFVLAQLEEYEKHRERCLSFRMRSEIVSRTDSSQLSRESASSGYRATATYGGPWAHWGDVLQLVPLSPDEASDFIAGTAGPVGHRRLGLQADSIAFRCGYQPAVLLALWGGRAAAPPRRAPRLQRGAHGQPRGRGRDGFHQPAVQDGDPHGGQLQFPGQFPGPNAVFAALLFEFALPAAGPTARPRRRGGVRSPATTRPGYVLVAVGRQQRARADHLSTQRLSWKRQLLVEKQLHGEAVYALKFPYHLSRWCC